jgi:hypothetical protein
MGGNLEDGEDYLLVELVWEERSVQFYTCYIWDIHYKFKWRSWVGSCTKMRLRRMIQDRDAWDISSFRWYLKLWDWMRSPKERVLSRKERTKDEALRLVQNEGRIEWANKGDWEEAANEVGATSELPWKQIQLTYQRGLSCVLRSEIDHWI